MDYTHPGKQKIVVTVHRFWDVLSALNNITKANIVSILAGAFTSPHQEWNTQIHIIDRCRRPRGTTELFRSAPSISCNMIVSISPH